MDQLLVPVPIGSSGQSEVNVIQPWIGCGSVAGVIGRFPGRTGVHGAPVVVEMSGAPQAFHFRYVLFESWLRLQFRLFPKLLLRLFRASYAGYDCDVFIKHRRGRMEAFILDACQTYALISCHIVYFLTLYTLIGLTTDVWRISALLDIALHQLVGLLESSMCLVLTNLQAKRKVSTTVVSVSI